MLRARDPDGRLGLKTAPDDLLAQARQRTRGYPRALEALAAILAADRDTTLPELLAETAALPNNVVEVLVGQAFNRLDPLAQQVMQALAIFNAPVPPVAIDYVLQPYRAAIDAAPVLRRLVNMQFVRRDAGRYYLHQVDRDYALSRVPRGTAGRPRARPAAVHPAGAAAPRRGLLRADTDAATGLEDPGRPGRAAQRVRASLPGRGLRHGGPRLVRDRLRLPLPWGHYQMLAEMHRRLLGRLDDSATEAQCKNVLGMCYWRQGQFEAAIDMHQEALAEARQAVDSLNELVAVGNIGICYQQLGYFVRAIEFLQRALHMTREMGDRVNESGVLGNLTVCYYRVGDLDHGMDVCLEATAIAREVGDRNLEASGLINLGDYYRDLAG